MAGKQHGFIRGSLLFIIVIIFTVGVRSGRLAAGEDAKLKVTHSPLVFSTWEGFEVDKCAAIWLIKRFIDKDAQFKFISKGEIITEGIPFDTPDAEMRRTQTQSTFESIALKYAIKDEAVQKMGSIINDIEVNVWGKKVYQESRQIVADIRKIMDSSQNSGEIIQKSDNYFDGLYDVIKAKITPAQDLK